MDRTIRDYHNDQGQNVALWLDGDYALRYADIDRRLRGYEAMTPQPNLATPNTHVTVILPRAFEGPEGRCQRVQPSSSLQDDFSRSDRTVAAYGLRGEVRSGDIFGIMVPAVQEAINNNDGFIELWYPDVRNPDGLPVLWAILDLFARADLQQFLGRRFNNRWGGGPM